MIIVPPKACPAATWLKPNHQRTSRLPRAWKRNLWAFPQFHLFICLPASSESLEAMFPPELSSFPAVDLSPKRERKDHWCSSLRDLLPTPKSLEALRLYSDQTSVTMHNSPSNVFITFSSFTGLLSKAAQGSPQVPGDTTSPSCSCPTHKVLPTYTLFLPQEPISVPRAVSPCPSDATAKPVTSFSQPCTAQPWVQLSCTHQQAHILAGL